MLTLLKKVIVKSEVNAYIKESVKKWGECLHY